MALTCRCRVFSILSGILKSTTTRKTGGLNSAHRPQRQKHESAFIVAFLSGGKHPVLGENKPAGLKFPY
jgi:hypothetical protein